MKRLLVLFSFAMFALFATTTPAQADPVSLVLMSHTGGSYHYGISVDANTYGNLDQIDQNEYVMLTGLAGVTSIESDDGIESFTNTFTPTSITSTEMALNWNYSNPSDTPTVYGLFTITSSSTTLGSVEYSISSGYWTGTTQGPVADNPNPPSPVPEPSSIVLLGTGLFAAAGVIRRKLTA